MSGVKGREWMLYGVEKKGLEGLDLVERVSSTSVELMSVISVFMKFMWRVEPGFDEFYFWLTLYLNFYIPVVDTLVKGLSGMEQRIPVRYQLLCYSKKLPILPYHRLSFDTVQSAQITNTPTSYTNSEKIITLITLITIDRYKYMPSRGTESRNDGSLARSDASNKLLSQSQSVTSLC